MCTTTIEMVSYRLKAGISIEDLRATHSAVNNFCLAQPGFLYRSISQDEHQTWFDVVYWKTMDDAKAAGEAFMQSNIGQILVNLIDNTTMQMRHMLADAEAYPQMLAIYANHGTSETPGL
ncbi:hypothetical protein [Paraglaciecola hydrolytica]|uniref:ABM domain-containing protein n=1 Tax=Paraglaciecola hydrolytica TaxID=1799789 RepID=A0A136A2D4_9ALTE|nr:hypothetical protein [Paraglaciecola hydrolytica]KXI29367.1 hypothetical protein AX660_14615 [Paraglaciecola hydrolytica]